MHRITRTWRAFRRLPEIVQFGAMLATAILVMLAMPKSVLAEDMIARQGKDEVVISDTACTHAGTLIQIDKVLPGQRAQFRRAEARFQGHRYFACWRAAGFSVHLVYEDGDQGIVPAGDFKPVVSI